MKPTMIHPQPMGMLLLQPVDLADDTTIMQTDKALTSHLHPRHSTFWYSETDEIASLHLALRPRLHSQMGKCRKSDEMSLQGEWRGTREEQAAQHPRGLLRCPHPICVHGSSLLRTDCQDDSQPQSAPRGDLRAALPANANSCRSCQHNNARCPHLRPRAGAALLPMSML